MDRQRRVCERLELLGYRREHTVKIYGEEVRLTSNPVPEGSGFVVDGISVRSSVRRRIRVPLPIVKMVEREIALRPDRADAA